MLGSLYGDLPQAKDSDSSAAPSDSKPAAAWAAAHLRAPPRRPSQPTTPQAGRTGRGRGAGRGRGSSSGQQPSADAGNSGSSAPGQPSRPAASLFSAVGAKPLENEYDPARPTDYEAIRAERERLRIEAEEEADRQDQLRRTVEKLAAADPDSQRSAQPGSGGASDMDADDRVDEERASAGLGLSGEEAFARRARLSKGDAAGGPEAAANGTAAGQPKGMNLAAKLMEQMGWRGGGLGKTQQGIATPLIAQKKDARSGVIAQAEDSRPRQGAAISGPPTKVVLLRNMVGPGQVDEDLEDEVGTECTGKYGKVTGVMIFEVTQPGFPPELAVRIFVAFERQEDATKAAVDLGGRFFGGRMVRATFYDEDKFAANDLAPDPATGE